MSEIIANESSGKSKGKRRAKKHSTHIDMTPMVDLACLLLTFFMLTTAFSKPKVMEIVLPEKKVNPDPPKIDNALTIILDKDDKVYYYVGKLDKPPFPELIKTDFSKDGLRKLLLNRNSDLFSKITSFNEDVMKSKKNIPADSLKRQVRALKKADNLSPFVMIKAAEDVKYGNIVDVIDELEITNMPRYAIIDINPVEIKMLEEKRKLAK